MITRLLRTAASLVPETGVDPAKIQTRSLRAGGAMALLCGQVDTDMIKFVGRWRSDAMFRYLHAQATPIINAEKMHTHGTFQLENGADVPVAEQHILKMTEGWSPSSSAGS